MSSPYVGEIRMFGGNFAPSGWMFCEGQILPISQYETLFNLVGTTYGGDGQSTFALPDLRGRIPIHTGSGYVQGQAGGAETIILSAGQMPAHSHSLSGTTAIADQRNPVAGFFAQPEKPLYAPPDATPPALDPNAVGPSGSNQPHDNMQPFLCVSFIISLFGIFPSQN